MSTCILADDEPHLAQALQAQLATVWPELQVLAVARNGVEAAERIAALQPDVAFLDIQMPGLTGLEVAQGIEGPTQVVFVTAYDAYAVEAFEQAALDYVLKPVKAERLQRTVERVRKSLAQPAEGESSGLLGALQKLLPAQAGAPAGGWLRWVRASRGEVTEQIPVDDVLYFHADEKYTCVRTVKAEHLIRTPIAELAGLLDPAHFWQVHRSTLVNLSYVEGTRRDEASRLYVRFRGQATELPVSRAYVHRFKAM